SPSAPTSAPGSSRRRSSWSCSREDTPLPFREREGPAMRSIVGGGGPYLADYPSPSPSPAASPPRCPSPEMGEGLMYAVTLAGPDDFDGWRAAARALASAGVSPSEVTWRVEGEAGDDLFGVGAPPPEGTPFPVPRPFLTLAETAICHSDPERFALLYALLLRIRTNPRAL